MLKCAAVCPHPPIIIPSIGQNNISKVKPTITAMNELGDEIERIGISTIIVISPHGPVQMNSMFINSAEEIKGNFAEFGSSDYMEFKNDVDLVFNIKNASESKKISVEDVNGWTFLDHGAMVPLHFLTKHNKNIKIVHIAFSYLSYQKHFEFGEAIYEAIENVEKNIAVVASGDLSHRLTPDAPAGYSPKGKEFDNLLIDLLEKNEVSEILNLDSSLVEEAGECGLRSIIILLGLISCLQYKFKKLSYEGPFGVGYLVGKFEI